MSQIAYGVKVLLLCFLPCYLQTVSYVNNCRSRVTNLLLVDYLNKSISAGIISCGFNSASMLCFFSTAVTMK